MLSNMVFERYLISNQIHENDLIVVYSGEDRQTNQAIRITVVKNEMIPAKDFLARFEPLAKTIAHINSSQIIKALEFGEADGQAVIVWEGVDGRSLADRLADGNGFPLDLSLDLAMQLGSYLDAIHNQKIMQGVFDPEDILLSDENTVRVMNLGVWGAINLGEALFSAKAKATPYHAPELTRGEHETIRADFYSLGALLYKVLTGKDPTADPLPSRVRADIPSDWDELITKCMNPDPAKRVQSAAEFINRLDEMRRATKMGKGNSVMGMEDSLIGHTLGAYRLVDRLGQGGMATVYKAYEAALDRYVAIKVLPQFFANDPMFAQRFRREAKAVAQLNHPNIVPIYTYGEENGITYIAMQFIEGGTLKHESDQVYRSEDALRLLLPIARALGYAHKRGIIHRDIKPSNVLLSEDGWPVLTDFGLAQMAQASTKLTESGVGMGTPTYMSPEQGQGDKVDHRTDIYSFGIMLYELVTGEAPFHADTPMAVVIKHLTAPMPMPHEINPNIPEEVETLILKATAKNPDDRFQTAEEMALAMEHALNLPSVTKEERNAEPSIPKYSEPVVSRPPAPVAAPPVVAAVALKETSKAKKIFRTLIIVGLLILGLPCLGVTLMGIFDICPPQGPWDQPPWCTGSPYVAPFINPPIVETLPPTPMITEGTLGDILFQDDFEGGISPRWQFTASPYLVPWVAEEFEGRTVFHSMPANFPGETSDAEIRDTRWENYAIEFDFRFLKPDQFGYHYFALRGRLTQCPPTVRSVQMYEAVISPDKGILKKSICKEGSQQEIASSDKDFDVEGWHTLQYIFIGNRIQLLIDGKSFIDYTDAQDALTGGDLWIETGGSAEVLFDNFKVYEIIPGEEGSVPVEGQQSLCLDGHGSYVEVPYSESLNLPQALTLEAWVQVSDFPQDECGLYGLCSFAPVINQGQRYSSAGNYTLFLTPQKLGFVFQPQDSKLAAPVESWQGWNHIAVNHTFGDGRGSRLYLNGKALGQLQWTNDKGLQISGDDPFPYQVSPYYLGKLETQGAFLSGCLDEIRIWDHVRTQQEIQETMYMELTGSEEGLAGYWKFNEAEGSTLVSDSSPNNNDGQLYGNATLKTSDAPVSALKR
jgi:serine/threonine protein kinase